MNFAGTTNLVLFIVALLCVGFATGSLWAVVAVAVGLMFIGGDTPERRGE